jgi:hypothetical protein
MCVYKDYGLGMIRLLMSIHEHFKDDIVRTKIYQGALQQCFSVHVHMGQTDCPICMETFEKSHEVTTLPCSNAHYFHTGCISDWISRGKNICPLCRDEITLEGIENV